ncbi:uncharacterized protein VP01_583g1 [Puccinia sorghi]|uniref:Reverse transcriptase Ty1/copia-type domain-containing protein n=1 Tax=Puccinia sorghi TaxID=27349 RepID=A0A0L6UI53_9BASI|nr:uncharacterized protein VP01_583g1 [Puccinia sorghi]
MQGWSNQGGVTGSGNRWGSRGAGTQWGPGTGELRGGGAELVLDTHWRRNLSYLLSRFFFPHRKSANSLNAFVILNSRILEKDVFIKNPKGVNQPTLYFKLKKSLYGLKHSPKNWYKTLTNWLHSIGFIKSSRNPCLYICNDNMSWIFFHVDNLVLVGPGNNFEKGFESQFSNSSCCEPNTILGMKYEQENNKIKLSLPKHIKHGLEELGFLQEASDEYHTKFKKLNINYRSAIGLINHICNGPKRKLNLQQVLRLAEMAIPIRMLQCHISPCDRPLDLTSQEDTFNSMKFENFLKCTMPNSMSKHAR